MSKYNNPSYTGGEDLIDKISAKIQAKKLLLEECEKADKHKEAAKHYCDLQTLVRLRIAYKAAVDQGLI